MKKDGWYGQTSMMERELGFWHLHLRFSLFKFYTAVYRRRHVKAKYLEASTEIHEPVAEPESEDEAVLSACFRELIPTLKPEYAKLIAKLELTDGDPGQVAEQLGINGNNLKVRRRRARQALRQRLEKTCRVCAKHGCLDCTCRRG